MIFTLDWKIVIFGSGPPTSLTISQERSKKLGLETENIGVDFFPSTEFPSEISCSISRKAVDSVFSILSILSKNLRGSFHEKFINSLAKNRSYNKWNRWLSFKKGCSQNSIM